MNCEICGSKNNLVVHHIDNNPSNNTYKNLQFLCQSCYMKIHKPKPICSVAACIMPKKYEPEPVNGWISVDDRLPEPKTWVMVYIKYSSPVFEIERGIHKMGDIKKVFYDGFYDAFCKDKSFCGFGTITHWQPLPEPPKGE